MPVNNELCFAFTGVVERRHVIDPRHFTYDESSKLPAIRIPIIKATFVPCVQRFRRIDRGVHGP